MYKIGLKRIIIFYENSYCLPFEKPEFHIQIIIFAAIN